MTPHHTEAPPVFPLRRKTAAAEAAFAPITEAVERTERHIR
jgi:hypothetical protein